MALLGQREMVKCDHLLSAILVAYFEKISSDGERSLMVCQTEVEIAMVSETVVAAS